MQLSSTLRLTAGSVLVLSATMAIGGCDLAMSDLRAQAREEWTRTYTVPADGVFEIVNVNGSIDVEASDGASVEVRAERIAKAPSDDAARELLKRVEITETTSADGVRLETKSVRLTGLFSGQMEVRYHVRVPPSLRVRVETTNGRIQALGLRGPLTAETTNGGITGRRLGGRVQASTTNGSIEIEMDKVTDDGVKLETTNGGITLRVPEGTKATIAASTVNGGIDPSGLPIQELEKSRRKLSAYVNGGGARLALETTNGAIRITRSL